jgi:hypothetical protein
VVVKRRAAAAAFALVAVDAMDRLAGVFLEVGARQLDPMQRLADVELDRPPCTTGVSYWLIW